MAIKIRSTCPRLGDEQIVTTFARAGELIEWMKGDEVQATTEETATLVFEGKVDVGDVTYELLQDEESLADSERLVVARLLLAINADRKAQDEPIRAIGLDALAVKRLEVEDRRAKARAVLDECIAAAEKLIG